MNEYNQPDGPWEIEWRGPRFVVEQCEGYFRVAPPTKITGAIALLESPSGRFFLVEQYRFALEKVSLELPRGGAEPGEDVVACALREAFEETGLIADRTTASQLGVIAPDSGFVTYELPVVHARVDTETAPGPTLPDEIIRVHSLSIGEISQKIASGQLTDGYTMAALALWMAKRG